MIVSDDWLMGGGRGEFTHWSSLSSFILLRLLHHKGNESCHPGQVIVVYRSPLKVYNWLPMQFIN